MFYMTEQLIYVYQYLYTVLQESQIIIFVAPQPEMSDAVIGLIN